MGPKTMKVYETLREQLASGRYVPGDKFPSERALAEELGIGRTALRQVLARLVAEGALEVRGRSSYRVPGVVSVQTPEGLEPWRIHGERDLYDNQWVKLQLWDVEPPGMERFEHHVVKLQHVAITAVVDDQDRVLMMWRYRFVPGRFGWELPGGIVDEGEAPHGDSFAGSRGRDRVAPEACRARRHVPTHGRHGRLSARDLRSPRGRKGRRADRPGRGRTHRVGTPRRRSRAHGAG